MRHFVIAATGRSGTTFSALALSRMGYRCSHEVVFSPWPPWGFHGWLGYDGDASCFSVPFIADLPTDTLVIHQVREPLAAIRSLATWGIFRPFSVGRHVVMPVGRALRGKPPRELSLRFMKAYAPHAYQRRGELARAAQHWIDWNRQIEHSVRAAGLQCVRIRLEDIDAEMLHTMGKMIDGQFTDIVDLDTSVNARPVSRFPSMTLDDLPLDLHKDVLTMGGRYGYSPIAHPT